MSSVAGLTTDIFIGVPAPLRQTGEKWRVPGLDGYGAQTLGLGDGEFNVVTVAYCDSPASAKDFTDQAAALAWTVVSVVDDFGDTYNNILIEAVDTTSPGTKRPVIYQGNPNAVRVQVSWRMCTTQ